MENDRQISLHRGISSDSAFAKFPTSYVLDYRDLRRVYEKKEDAEG